MRINRFVAQATGMSRRAADRAVSSGKLLINNKPAELGSEVKPADKVTLDGRELQLSANHKTIMLNKPSGYVCSRQGQGSKTVYELLPAQYHSLKPIGRLDKDTSGLLLLTDDGELANNLTHPRYQKEKVYSVKLNKPLDQEAKNKLQTGVKLSDGLSKFIQIKDCSDNIYEVTLAEGRNRQIRRTFNSLGYKITLLSRVKFGGYGLGNLHIGKFKEVVIGK